MSLNAFLNESRSCVKCHSLIFHSFHSDQECHRDWGCWLVLRRILISWAKMVCGLYFGCLPDLSTDGCTELQRKTGHSIKDKVNLAACQKHNGNLLYMRHTVQPVHSLRWIMWSSLSSCGCRHHFHFVFNISHLKHFWCQNSYFAWLISNQYFISTWAADSPSSPPTHFGASLHFSPISIGIATMSPSPPLCLSNDTIT